MNLFHSPNFTFTFRQQKHDPMPWWKTNSALDMNCTIDKQNKVNKKKIIRKF